jgi:hypothetical protein
MSTGVIYFGINCSTVFVPARVAVRRAGIYPHQEFLTGHCLVQDTQGLEPIIGSYLGNKI